MIFALLLTAGQEPGKQYIRYNKTEIPLFSRIIVYNMIKVKIFCQCLAFFVDFIFLTFVIVYIPYFSCDIYIMNSFQLFFLYACFL